MLRIFERRPGPQRVEDARKRANGAGTHTIRAFTPVFDGLWQLIDRARRMGPCVRRDDLCKTFCECMPMSRLVNSNRELSARGPIAAGDHAGGLEQLLDLERIGIEI